MIKLKEKYQEWQSRVHIRYRVSATSKCNNKCFFCHNEGRPVDDCFLKPTQLKTFLKSAHRIAVKEIILTGGEWTISPYASDLIEIMDKTSPKKALIVFSTNGILLSKFIPELVKIRPHIIRISLHAIDNRKFKAITGLNVRPVIESITEACKAGLHVVINLTLCRQNGLKEAFKVIEFARQVGAKEVKISDLLWSNNDTRGQNNDLNRDWISPQSMLDYLGDKFTLDHVERPKDMLGSTMYLGYCRGLKLRFKMPQAGLYHGKSCIDCPYKSDCREGLYSLRLTPDLKLKTCLLRPDLNIDLTKELNTDDVEGLANKVNNVLSDIWFNSNEDQS